MDAGLSYILNKRREAGELLDDLIAANEDDVRMVRKIESGSVMDYIKGDA